MRGRIRIRGGGVGASVSSLLQLQLRRVVVLRSLFLHPFFFFFSSSSSSSSSSMKSSSSSHSSSSSSSSSSSEKSSSVSNALETRPLPVLVVRVGVVRGRCSFPECPECTDDDISLSSLSSLSSSLISSAGFHSGKFSKEGIGISLGFIYYQLGFNNNFIFLTIRSL